MKKIILLLAAGCFLSSCALHRGASKTSGHSRLSQTAAKADSARKDTTLKLKPYTEVITARAITKTGLIKVHELNDRWFFEIGDSLFNKDILVVNRISKAAAATESYGGDWIGENVIRFVRGPRYKIFIQRISYRDIAKDSSENGLYRSILNSSFQPIVASFDIRTISPDSVGYVIDVTDIFNSDNDVFSFDPKIKKGVYQLSALQADKSYIRTILAFPLNTEIKTVKTYLGGVNNQLRSYELNSSMVLLPAIPMKPRYADERVGYFSRGYINFDMPQQLDVDFMITRWRLDPKKEDEEKYKSGELVEPQKPIVFYIDPATPKKWVSYLIEGVNAWQKTFEKAGFKNAIYAREVPASDTTWSLEDARHNVIVYKASPIQNASGPQVSDPRSGEILESHINWYHNVQQILRDWYFIQAGPNDPAARRLNFDDALMGRLIKMVCTHEVGHTLGLMHNFVASSTVPVDSLRSRNYVSKHGHTPSIMDYARFNYVAQPEDSIAVEDLTPRIGVYDEWAIEWGYRWMHFNSIEDERTYMNQWIIKRTEKDPRLFYSDMFPGDPRNQMDDLGDNAMMAGYYGIKNLKRVKAHLKDWSATPNKRISNDMDHMFKLLIGQYRQYLSKVTPYIGGLYRTPRTVEQRGPILEFIPREKQREAVLFLNRELFDRQDWLDDNELFPYIGGGSLIWMTKIQEWYLHHLVSANRWNAMVFAETMQPKGKAYTFTELLDDLERTIWKELGSGKPIDIYRRNLQKIYILKIIDMTRYGREGDMSVMDPFTIATVRMQSLHKKLFAAMSNYSDVDTKGHLMDLCIRLKAALDYQKHAFPGIAPMSGRVNVEISDRGFKHDSQMNLYKKTISTETISPQARSCWRIIED